MAKKKKKPNKVIRSIHDVTIDMLVDELSTDEQYVSIRKNVEYSNKGYKGELDIEAITIDNWYHYFEVKTTYNRKSYKKASGQIHRYMRAYPTRKIKGFYKTPDILIEVKTSV